MGEEIRLQVPGGALTVQDLRDLVGWAGAAGASGFRIGDAQDLVLEAAAQAPGLAPGKLRRADRGSLQSSAFGGGPSAALPWLTTGVWMDLLAELGDVGPLDVQLLHDPEKNGFLRHGHVRLVARKAAHQWEVQLRRPGTDRLAVAEPVSTAELAPLIERAQTAWADRDERFWSGSGPVPSNASLPQTPPPREGFGLESSATFSFGFAPNSGRISVPLLRDLAWLAADTGASRAWLTPLRSLVFQGIPGAKRSDWESWLHKNRLPERHGDLESAAQGAGYSLEVQQARDEVMAFLRLRDRVPRARRILVATEGLNRDDGVSAQPYPLLVRTPSTWQFRSGDGSRSGEGSLELVMEAIDALDVPRSPQPLASLEPARPEMEPSISERCPDCQTVYDPVYGDPRGGILPGVEFRALPPDWECPVCALPGRQWAVP